MYNGLSAVPLAPNLSKWRSSLIQIGMMPAQVAEGSGVHLTALGANTTPGSLRARASRQASFVVLWAKNAMHFPGLPNQQVDPLREKITRALVLTQLSP